MRALLLSIKPRHARNIKGGSKTVELRRVAPKIAGEMLVLIYESSPVMAVTAMALVSAITCAPLDDMWQQHGPATQITKEEYYQYYEGRDRACALHIERVVLFPTPFTLEELRQLNVMQQPPQSYRFLGPQQFKQLGMASV